MNAITEPGLLRNRLASTNVSLGRRRKKVSVSRLMEIGNQLHKADRLSEAESVFRAILDHQPNNPAALHFLGVIAHQVGRQEEATRLVEKALLLAPGYHQAHNNLGNIFVSMQRYDDAAEQFRKAITLIPSYADAYFNLGLALKHGGNVDEALAAFKASMAIEPGRADTYYEIAQCYQRLGNRIQSQIFYRLALGIEPEHFNARLNLGNVLSTLGLVEKAIAEYDLGLESAPECIRLLNSKGVAQRKIGRFDEALANTLEAEKIDPTNIETLNTLGAAYQTIGDNQSAAKIYWRALALMPEAECAHKCLLFVALNMPHLTSQELYGIHRQVRGHFDRPDVRDKSFPDRDRTADRRLRVGYISSDFRTHVVAMNILPLVANHDHQKFEIFMYSQVEYPDNLTAHFENFSDHWRPIVGKSNEEVAKIVEEDKVDILVILAGRFDENRPLVAAFRPAPIQVSFHDCATSGLEAMDYFLTDSILHPADTPELFTEQLYRLPVYYQYPIQNGLPNVSPLPARENGFVTFGCFNKPEKINDEVVALWGEVLRAVPGSRLFLKYFNHYSQSTMRRRWEARFREAGIEPDRLIFGAGMDDRRDHLELYDNIDIALDPFPFNGATTTFEALTMGVPVVTLLGRHFVDRVAASMVTHAGFPGLVAADRDAYVALAAGLASDLDRLAEMRRTLRDKLHASPLCDGPTYARSVEEAFRDLWQTWAATGGYRWK